MTGSESSLDLTTAGKLTTDAGIFVDLLAAGEFVSAYDDLAIELKKTIDIKEMKAFWKNITDRSGPFIRKVRVRQETYPSNYLFVVTCQFEQGPLDLKISFNRSGKINGILNIND